MLLPHVLPVLALILAAFLPLNWGQLSQVVVGDHGEVGVVGGAAAEKEQLQPGIYIVHVQPPEHMLSAGPEEVEEWHKSFLPSPTLDSGEPRLVFSYKTVLSGFAARLTAEEVRAMESKEGFLRALPDQELIPLTTHTPDFLGLRPAVWNAANNGTGAIIGVVDTGITHTHASFSGNFITNPPSGWNGRCYFLNRPTCNDKLLGAVAYDYNWITNMYVPVPPFDDADGHGTHVAGIAGGLQVHGANVHNLANGTAAGAAPGAYLAMYKATTAATLLMGIERAITDRVHIISISMSFKNKTLQPFYRNYIAIGALAAVKQGILVSCAAGNSGPWKGTLFNDAPWIMTVGASTLGRVLRLNLRLGNGDVVLGESLYRGAAINGDLVYPGSNGRLDAKHCDNVSHVNIQNKIVMCHDGWYKPRWTAMNMSEVVHVGGGLAMICLPPWYKGYIITSIPDVLVPTVAVNVSDAERVKDYVTKSAGPHMVELMPMVTLLQVPPFPAVPAFSSRGPSRVNGGILKPDILGPGVNILSAESFTHSGFSLKSGTSMATPHLSGVAAILKLYFQSRHNLIQWTPAMIRSAIMTTGETTNRQGGPITDETDKAANLFATGAGHVNPRGAMNPGLVYNIEFDDYVRYLCGIGYSQSQIWETAKVVEDCSATGRTLHPEQLNYPSISVNMSLSSPGASKKIRRTVTSLHPHSYTATHQLSPTQRDVSVSVHPVTLNFMAEGERQTFEVEFYLARFPRAKAGDILQGHLQWASAAHTVTSPLLVTFVN